MKILICLDYSSFTENFLDKVRSFVKELKTPEIIALHLVNEELFYASTGYEVQLGAEIEKENKELKDLCHQYLGTNVTYIEEFGIPVLKINEEILLTGHDIIIAGSHSSHGLGERLMGSFTEHLLRISKKPVLIIP